MQPDDRPRLCQQLDSTYRNALALVRDIDPTLVIYTDGGWRVKDILAHLVTWEEQVLKSLQAHSEGREYHIPDFALQPFNEANFQQHYEDTIRQIHANWERARLSIKEVVGTFPLVRLTSEMRYPSGRRGWTIALIEEVMSHQQEHMDDVLRLVGRSTVAEKKRYLIQCLDDTLTDALMALANVNHSIIIYADGSWRVKDIIAHLVAWEETMLTSLEAYHNGGEYRLSPYSEDKLNEQFFQKRKDYPVEQVYREWSAVRERVKAVVNAMSSEQFEGDLLFPWGARGTVAHLIINDMLGHQREHMDAVLKFLNDDERQA